METYDIVLGIFVSTVVGPLVQYLDTKTRLVGEIIRSNFWIFALACLACYGLMWWMDITMTTEDLIIKALAATGVGAMSFSSVKAGSHIANGKK